MPSYQPAAFWSPPSPPSAKPLWSFGKTVVAIVISVAVAAIVTVAVSYADPGSSTNPGFDRGRSHRGGFGGGGGRFGGPGAGVGGFGGPGAGVGGFGGGSVPVPPQPDPTATS